MNREYCERLAKAHSMTLDEWIDHSQGCLACGTIKAFWAINDTRKSRGDAEYGPAHLAKFACVLAVTFTGDTLREAEPGKEVDADRVTGVLTRTISEEAMSQGLLRAANSLFDTITKSVQMGEAKGNA